LTYVFEIYTYVLGFAIYIYLKHIYIYIYILLRPNPEGFIFMSWKEREGGGMEGRKQ